MAAAVPDGELAWVREDLGRVQRQIEDVEAKISHAFAETMKEGGPTTESGKMWMERERQLREEKKQLREEKKQLRDKEKLLLEHLLRQEEERRKAAAQPAPVGQQVEDEGIIARLTRIEALVKKSSTVTASNINDTDLERVLDEHHVIIMRASESQPWMDVIQYQLPEPPLFEWEEGKSEVWHKNEYISLIQSWLPGFLVAVDVTSECQDLLGPSSKLSGRNDVVVVPERCRGHDFRWAVLGIELKTYRRFTAQAIRQAQAEFLLFASKSELPFVQMVTDLNRGAVMYYYSGTAETGKRVVEEMAVVSMESVRSQVEKMCLAIGPDIGGRGRDNVTPIAPSVLPEPKRAKFAALKDMAQLRSGEALAAFFNNVDDVANLADLDAFQIPEHMPDQAPPPPLKGMYA